MGSGDGSNRTFYTDNKPIVPRRNSSTPLAVDDVIVYASGTPVSVISIDGDLGQIVLTATPASGTPITADYDWSNLDEDVLDIYAKEAHNLVVSKIGETYVLPLSEIPEAVKLIEKKLAAGLLLDKEYSVGGDETEDNRGRRWIKWAEQKLEDIASGDFLLLDSNGDILTQLESQGISGWPNNDTADAEDEDAGGDVKFRISKEF